MANLRGQLALRVALDARACETHTTYQWAAGGAVLTLSSTLPEAGLALELISNYVGQRNVATVATHLALGPVGHPPTISHDEHDHHELDPIEQPRRCVYDHAHQLLQTLSEYGWQASVHVNDLTFTALDRVE